jgi:glycosyltransferase 2 family protein
MKRHTYWIGFALSLFFLFLFLRKMDLANIWEVFKGVDYLYTVPLMAINFGTLWIRARRWAYLLKPIKQVSTGPLFKATAIGFMANNLLPARIGEFVRAFLLGSRERISKTASLATIVVERLFDGFAILFLFFLILLFMPFPPAKPGQVITVEMIKVVGIGSFLFYCFVLGALLLLRFENRTAKKAITFLFDCLPGGFSRSAQEKLNSFVNGLEVLKKDKDILIILGYSLALWTILSLSIYLLYQGFQLKLSLLSAFFVETVLVFGVSIPSAPGFIGTYHWACAAALIFLGVEVNLAKGYAVVHWVANFLPMTGTGLFLLWKEGLSLRALSSEEDKGEKFQI